MYGTTMKITVKVTEANGCWLAWGTMPESLYGTCTWVDGKSINTSAQVGDEVEFTATLQPGNEPHFVFFKRPSKARIVQRNQS